MAKDPAQLFYFKEWLVSTAEMSAEERGWYINLLAHQMDKRCLPDDIEKLAKLANVSFSEYERFILSWKRTLKALFETDSEGQLYNPVTRSLQESRSNYTEKQQLRGIVGALIKKAKKEYALTSEQLDGISTTFFNELSVDSTKGQKEDCYKRTLTAYATSFFANANVNINKIEEKGGVGEKEERENDPELFEAAKQISVDQKSTDFELLASQVMADRDNFVRVFVQRGISESDLEKWLANFVSFLKFNGATSKSESEFRKHFGNWIARQKNSDPASYQPVNIFKDSKNQQNGTKYGSSARDRQTAASAAVSADLENTVRLIKSRPNYTGR